MTTNSCRPAISILMSEAEKQRLVANIAGHLSQVSKDDIVERSLSHLRKADGDYGDRVFKAVMERRTRR